MMGTRAARTPARRARALAAAAALVACAGAVGCGPFALLHDAYIGPISPAGRIHTLVVGEDFYVDDDGPRAGKPRAYLAPIPPNVLERMSTLVPMTRGLTAAVASFSLIVTRDAQAGEKVPAERLAELRTGATPGDVLAQLGPPRHWIKRRSGSIMLYQYASGDGFSFYIGMPPGLGNLLPIPGLNNLTFRYTRLERGEHNTMLFFDREDRLYGLVATAPFEDGSVAAKR